MARLQVAVYEKPSKKKRPGVHAKSKSSSLKTSKNYKKKYNGQGRWDKYVYLFSGYHVVKSVWVIAVKDFVQKPRARYNELGIGNSFPLATW